VRSFFLREETNRSYPNYLIVILLGLFLLKERYVFLKLKYSYTLGWIKTQRVLFSPKLTSKKCCLEDLAE